jgi:pSer/pThr/pTyr-binding forkhead associated (FHA) protein
MVLMSLRLIIEDDEGATTIVPLGEDAITIGRQQGNTIQLTEKNVSRQHARLFPDSDVWVIEDLNSYNGIKVNDKSVEGRTNLREGDIVQIGDYHLAITEDVDKSTLNYGRTGAANDVAPAVVDPLLASSSADLPRLSVDEIQALQSGPQPITPPPQPALMDSGPVPASYATSSYGEEPKRGAGVLVGFGVVVLLALGGAIFWLATTGNSPDAAVATSDGDKTPDVKTPQKAPPMPPEPEVLDDGADEAVPEDDGGDEAAVIDDEGGALDDGAADGVVVEPPPDPVPDPTPTNNGTGRPKTPKTPKTTPKKPPTTTPTPPPEPAGPSAEELLDEARKLQFKSPGAAYKKAKASYDKKKDGTALSIMVRTACKMGDATKAKAAYKKMSGSLKADAESVCSKLGITL